MKLSFREKKTPHLLYFRKMKIAARNLSVIEVVGSCHQRSVRIIFAIRKGLELQKKSDWRYAGAKACLSGQPPGLRRSIVKYYWHICPE